MSVIAMDVDDVVANLVNSWLCVYNLEYQDILEEIDIKTWDIGSYTKIGNLMYDYLTPVLYDHVIPVEGSMSGVKKLREMGHRVIFVTSFLPNIAGRKYYWLKGYSFLDGVNDYIEAHDKSLIKYDYLIDDNPKNVMTASGVGIVYTREWNKHMDESYPRVNNWNDIINYFTEV